MRRTCKSEDIREQRWQWDRGMWLKYMTLVYGNVINLLISYNEYVIKINLVAK